MARLRVNFFDWVLAGAEGEELVRRIMAHVRRFRLAEVESDVLKILYESLIDRDECHGLSEYYTPDWLAAKIVKTAVSTPLEQRVLDPACGSGTFLFHAIRKFLREAEEVAAGRVTEQFLCERQSPSGPGSVGLNLVEGKVALHQGRKSKRDCH